MLNEIRIILEELVASLLSVFAAAAHLVIHVRGSMSGNEIVSSSRGKPKNYTSPLARLVLSSFAGLGSAQDRFFVDLAANHPTQGSSSYELEERGWSGLCVEPNPAYATMLRANRKCTVAQTAVDSVVRNVTFRFAGEMGGIEDRRFDNTPRGPAARTKGARKSCDDLKHIAMCSYLDGRKPGLCEQHRVDTAPCVQAHLVMPGRTSKQCRRDNAKSSACTLAGQLTKASSSAPSATLTTASLHEVLRAHGAPPVIAYFSLDVEGAESAVLSSGFAW